MPPYFDRVKAACKPRARRPLRGIGGRIIGEVILAEEPELLVSRGERTGDVGGEAGFQAGLDLLAVLVANIRHGIERAAEDGFGLQRHWTEPIPVARIVGHIVGDNALGLTVHRRLHVVAHPGAAALPELHRTALRSRARALGLAAGLSLCLQTGIEELALWERLKLRLSIVRDGTTRCPRILLVILAVPFLEIALDALVDLLEELRELVRGTVARLGVDRFALAAVDGAEFPRAELPLLAQPWALTADLPKGHQVVLTAVRPRRVIRSQLLEQPHQLTMPVRRLCQATTRPETGERAVNVQLQQSSRVVSRPARGSGCGPLKAERREGEVVDKGIDETDGMLFGNVVVEPLWA